MRVLVVYESMFGNSAAVARAVADRMAEQAQVRVAEVGTRPEVSDVDAMVVGAPTHAFGLSRPATRAEAGRQGSEAPVDFGVREWLLTLRRLGLPVATFDTRVSAPFMPGSAARKAADMLRSAGCRLVLPPEGFLVASTRGPLRDGELDRARRWGALLVTRLLALYEPA